MNIEFELHAFRPEFTQEGMPLHSWDNCSFRIPKRWLDDEALKLKNPYTPEEVNRRAIKLDEYYELIADLYSNEEKYLLDYDIFEDAMAPSMTSLLGEIAYFAGMTMKWDERYP